MQHLEYANPSTQTAPLADNLVFRVAFALMGFLWNALIAYAHHDFGFAVERALADANPPLPAILPIGLEKSLDLQLHHVGPASVFIVSVLLALLSLRLLVHAVQHRRIADGVIFWPTRYWLVKLSLCGLLLLAAWAQYSIYSSLSEAMFPWTDNYKNPGPDDRAEFILICGLAVAIGLMPILSCLDAREPVLST